MSAIIIPFFPVYDQSKESADCRLYILVNAAWNFAKCALWPEQTFTSEEVDATMDYIVEYFRAAPDQKRAFIALIQRIILTQKYVSRSPERSIPMPSVWFNRRYPFGFAGTLNWLRKAEQRRKEVPGYLAHIELLARGYYRYTIQPSKLAINQCRTRLIEHGAHSLLQLFYNTIIHVNYIRA